MYQYLFAISSLSRLCIEPTSSQHYTALHRYGPSAQPSSPLNWSKRSLVQSLQYLESSSKNKVCHRSTRAACVKDGAKTSRSGIMTRSCGQQRDRRGNVNCMARRHDHEFMTDSNMTTDLQECGPVDQRMVEGTDGTSMSKAVVLDRSKARMSLMSQFRSIEMYNGGVNVQHSNRIETLTDSKSWKRQMPSEATTYQHHPSNL
jgi:hypothetical protein